MALRILVVDDERLILMGLKSVIGKITDISCEIDTAQSASAAIQKLEERPADLMITDVEMPGLSGLELIEKVRNKGWCKHFIILSGYDKFEYARTAIRLEAVDYLLKPVDKDELRRDICRIARGIEEERGTASDLMAPYVNYFPHIGMETVPHGLDRCVRFISEHYQDSISLTMLADYTGKTEGYLSSLFKKEWNTTFLEIVNEMRLRQAIYFLLYEPAVSVQDIAGKVGYKTERQLYRLVKSRIGVTPQQIRNEIGQYDGNGIKKYGKYEKMTGNLKNRQF